MAKVRVYTNEVGSFVAFQCPACKHGHAVPTSGNDKHKWQFNGDLEKPTITPSLRIFVPAIPDTPEYKGLPERTYCHVNVTEGMLVYHSDSPHELKGQTIPMVDWSE